MCLCVCRLEDFEGEEIDEEALIEQRRQQRMAIVQVSARLHQSNSGLMRQQRQKQQRNHAIFTFMCTTSVYVHAAAAAVAQKYKAVSEDTNMVSEPSSPQSSTRSRSPSPDDILERVAADVKEYERENLNTFEDNIKAKHNLIAQEKDGKAPRDQTERSEPSRLCYNPAFSSANMKEVNLILKVRSLLIRPATNTETVRCIFNCNCASMQMFLKQNSEHSGPFQINFNLCHWAKLLPVSVFSCTISSGER